MKTKSKPKCKCGAKLFTRGGIAVNKLCPKCIELKKQEKIAKHKLTKTYDQKTFKSLHNKCWKLMSLIVRAGATDSGGRVSCFTCSRRYHWTEMDCGHFWHDRLDFDRRNLKPQCDTCNRRRSGNLAEYSARLIRENGEEWFRQLEIDAKNSIYKTQDLINLLPQLQEEAKKYA
jgi:hypothetical protein